MEFDLNYKINPKINTLALLTQYEIDDLIKYLYTLNENIQWFEIIQKHLNTNNEKFIKHLKPLLWEDHTKNDDYNSEFELKGNPKLKNTFNKLSDLIFKLNLNKKNVIYIPRLDDIKINFIIDYVQQIKYEYTTFLNTFNFEYLFEESSDVKKLNDFYISNFPISTKNSKLFNNLLYSIFVNINSDEFIFDK